MAQDGTPVWDVIYSPFGAMSYISSAAGVANDMRFPGQWFQLESGLAYNWHRHYDASLGRYVQADPIGLRGGRNVYSYADQSPLVKIDRDGHVAAVAPFCIPVLIAAGAATGLRMGLQWWSESK